MLCSEDLTELSLEKELVTENDIIFINSAQKEVEDFQKELYINRKKDETVRKIKRLLELNRKRHSKVVNTINKYNSFTAEGYANYCKINYLIRQTTKKKNGKRYKFKSKNVDDAVSHYITHLILPSTIRYLSRTQPWVNMWSAYRANGVVFPQGCQMSQQQQLILMWSKMYDSISEASEPPERTVIEDDDMLDGWLLIRQEEDRNKDKDRSSHGRTKIDQAQEQYIVCNNIDEAKEIENRNSHESKKIKEQRFKTIYEKGEVKEFELPDVKRKILIECNKRSMKKNG